MKAIWLVFVCATVALSDDMTHRQKDVIHLLENIHDHSFHQDVVDAAAAYHPEDHLGDYEHSEHVEHFMDHYHKHESLHRDHYFNLFDPVHRKEAVELFEIFMDAKTYDTFFKTAAWAREHLNQLLFVYSYTVALLNREDTMGLHIPPMYEINPHYFTTTDVIQEAYSAKMKQRDEVIEMEFTGTSFNPEQWVAYFGEDIGLNNHHFHWHADFPFWWKQEYGHSKDRKGELFFYAHHMLTARFDAERLSNHLPMVEPLHWDHEIEQGFQPHTTYRKEGEFPFRPDHMHFHDLPEVTVTEMKTMEHRLKTAIDMGGIIDDHGEYVSINSTDGINTLGEIMESSACSKNAHYYGALHNLAHVMLSRVSDPEGKYGLPPGVMEHFETATRDPAFFRLHKYMDNIFKSHKDSLPPYTHEELDFPGVEVTDVTVDTGSTHNELHTHFDYFTFDLQNALDHSEGVADVDIKAKVKRLNHDPFTYHIKVHSDDEHVGVVRVFLAPEYNYFGTKFTHNQERWLMVELDRFTHTLHKGDNEIVRKSTESSATIPDTLSFHELKEKVEAGTLEYNKYNRHCGHPHRMLLPKGSHEGMVFDVFVMITDFENDKAYDHSHDAVHENSLSYCGTVHEKYPDNKPMGFPFDRRIDDDDIFETHNMFFRSVTIKHLHD